MFRKKLELSLNTSIGLGPMEQKFCPRREKFIRSRELTKITVGQGMGGNAPPWLIGSKILGSKNPDRVSKFRKFSYRVLKIPSIWLQTRKKSRAKSQIFWPRFARQLFLAVFRQIYLENKQFLRKIMENRDFCLSYIGILTSEISDRVRILGDLYG